MYDPEKPEPLRGAGQGTAFRAAEKRYQLHKEHVSTGRRGRRKDEFAVRPLDLTDVVTLEGEDCPGVTRLGLPGLPGLPPTATAFAFAAHPGLLLVRGALAPEQQRQLVVAALTRFNEPPNHTTHIRAYPAGLPGIWAAAQAGLRLQQPAGGSAPAAADGSSDGGSKESSSGSSGADDASSSDVGSIWGAGGSGPTAVSLLRKLRWATLGPPYDWTRRLYLRDAPHMPLPPKLRQLAVALAGTADQLLLRGCGGGASTACNATNCAAVGEEAQQQQQNEQQQQNQQQQNEQQQCGCQRPAAPYSPDAALVNYYYEGDTLNGHIDDAERCLHQPLVSLSLGCPAIFLMGADSKDVPPTALLLHSGDAVVLSGPARRCYHGMPRILTDHPLAEALCCGSACSTTGADSTACSKHEDGGGCGDLAFAPFARHMQRCRINISIRDVN